MGMSSRWIERKKKWKIKINRYIQCYGNKENKEKMKNWNKKIRKIKNYWNRM